MGHKETAGDETTLTAWTAEFARTNHQLGEFFQAIAVGVDFSHVSVAPQL